MPKEKKISLVEIQKRIEKIERRNEKVAQDKSWEVSFFRKILIACLTYFSMTIFSISTGINQPLLNAIVPTAGFLLSVTSLSWAKNLWIRSIEKTRTKR